ncbi:hypothetical protein HU200_015616 [Digitaria exilis]|uniref:Cytochrome P450 n=1 Tax=Digitaria exilis TaxID=1010633 RepID=A0A835F8J4_9POAL|nr:hypothetical protein HU200_015616 [Digitaria exilis]
MAWASQLPPGYSIEWEPISPEDHRYTNKKQGPSHSFNQTIDRNRPIPRKRDDLVPSLRVMAAAIPGPAGSPSQFFLNYDKGSVVLPLQSEHSSYATEMRNKVFIPDYRFLLTRKNRRVWQLDREIKSLLDTFVNDLQSGVQDHDMKDFMSFMAPASGDDGGFHRGEMLTSLLTWATVALAMRGRTALAMDGLAMDVVEVCGRRSTVSAGMEVCGRQSTTPSYGAPTPPSSTRRASPTMATGRGPREQMAVFLSFGGGGRVCMAVIVSKAALALVLQRCEVRPSPAYMDATVREEPDAEKKGSRVSPW